jgi:hypothetical protein
VTPDGRMISEARTRAIETDASKAATHEQRMGLVPPVQNELLRLDNYIVFSVSFTAPRMKSAQGPRRSGLARLGAQEHQAVSRTTRWIPLLNQWIKFGL